MSHGATVLLITDDPERTPDLEYLLRKDGDGRFKVTVTHSLEEGLEALKERTFQVAVMEFCQSKNFSLAKVSTLRQTHADLPLLVVADALEGNWREAMGKSGVDASFGRDASLEALLPRAIQLIVMQRAGARRSDEARRRVAPAKPIVQEPRNVDEELHLFRALMDETNDGLEVVDPETARILDINRRGCEAIGYTRQEMLGMTIYDISPTLTHFEWLCRMQLLRRQKAFVRASTRRRKDGVIFPVEVSVRLVQLDREYVVTSVRDISERVRAEEQLRDQARLLDLVADAVIVAERVSGRVTYWNHAAEKIFGVPAAMANNHPYHELLGGAGEEFEAFRTALERDGKWRGELRLKGVNDLPITVNLRADHVAELEGRAASVLIWASDITGQKNMEEQFLRAQRVEGIGTLASGMAHDLNNIFSPILMVLPLLRGEVDVEEKDSIVETIDGLARRGSEIVRQVLTYARGFDGKKTPVDVALTVDEVAHMAQETFPKSIALQVEKAEKLWSVMGDATQLHQVLLNLLINARDAMPEGGFLQLKAENFLMDSTFASAMPGASTGRYVRLTVTDSGQGIPINLHEKIFDPFFTTKAPGDGVGLGLSATLGIVRSHGGMIQVESQPGQGATFKVYLPAMGVVAEEATPPETTLRKGRGETVLLVDDEAGMRGVGKAVLERMGYAVLLASHGAEAIALYAERSGEIAVVVTDAVMPILDGCALVRALRKMNPGVKVIGTSGFHYDTQTVALRRLDLQAFLPKPFQASALLNVLDRVLHSNS